MGIIVNKLKKYKIIRNLLYKSYLKYIYLEHTFGKFFLKKYLLEKKLDKLSKILVEKDINKLEFDNGDYYIYEHGMFFLYVKESEGGSLHVLKDKSELKIYETLSKYIKKESIVFDIGANFGFFTMMMSKKLLNYQNEQNKIYSFEPVPKTYEYLRKNILKNNLSKKVSIFNIAVSDKKGKIFITTDKFGGNHIANKKNKKTANINSDTVDNICRNNNITKVDIIKCDVEGAELLVLKGAKKTILKNRPVLIVEIQENWTERFNYKPKELFELLKSYEYNYSLILSNSIVNGSNYLKIDQDIKRTNNFLFEYKK